jgi:outer membrane protein TolC
MKTTRLFFLGCLPVLAGANAQTSTPDADTNAPAWITQPLSLVDCLNLALKQNATILKAKSDLAGDLRRGGANPRRGAAAGAGHRPIQATPTRSAIETFPVPNIPPQPDQNWNAGIQIVQSIYEGGKMLAAIRAPGSPRSRPCCNIRPWWTTRLLEHAAGVLRRVAGRAADHRP